MSWTVWTERARGVLAALLVGVVGVAMVTRAHVDYVAPEAAARSPLGFLAEVLSDPVNVALLAIGLVAVSGLAATWLRWGQHVPDVRVLETTLRGYGRFVPWMLRLSLGLPLVGAGFSGFLFTPSIPSGMRIPLVGIGFLLLLGLAARVASAAGLGLWLGALIAHGAPILLAGEYIGGFLALIVLGPGEPSADHMLEDLSTHPGTWYRRFDPVYAWLERVREPLAPLRSYAPELVRVPLGLTFIYLGLAEKILDPAPGLALAHQLGLPDLSPLSAGMWVLGAGLVEVAVGGLLVAGLLARAASATAFAVLTVTLFALPNDPVLPHISLFGLSSVVFTLGAGRLSLDAYLRSSGEGEEEDRPAPSVPGPIG